jgi:hypothetical protein
MRAILEGLLSMKIGVSVMVKRRRRYKQTVPFKDRLMAFAQELREEASSMPSGQTREELLARARRADTAAHIDEWARSPGLQAPT